MASTVDSTDSKSATHHGQPKPPQQDSDKPEHVFTVPRLTSQHMNSHKKLQKKQMKRLRKAMKDAVYYLNELKMMNEQMLNGYQQQTPKNVDDQQKEQNDKQPKNRNNDKKPRFSNTRDLDEKIRQGFEDLVNFITIVASLY